MATAACPDVGGGGDHVNGSDGMAADARARGCPGVRAHTDAVLMIMRLCPGFLTGVIVVGGRCARFASCVVRADFALADVCAF